MLVTCFSTARSVTNIRSAIAWFERPSAISSSTSRSRGVSSPDWVVLALASDELVDDGGVERRAALGDTADGGRELVDVGDAILEQVADALGALREQLQRVAGLDVLREDEHADARVALADLLGRAQALVGVGRRHPDVHDRDVRAVHRNMAEQVVSGAGLGHDLEACVLEQPRDPFAQEDGVVGEDDAERRRAGPGAERREGVGALVVELEDPLRLRQVREGVEPEVAQLVAGERGARRLRGEHLAAVARAADPARPVDVDSDVAVLSERRLTGVEADAHAHGRAGPGVLGERSLGGDRGGGGRVGVSERRQRARPRGCRPRARPRRRRRRAAACRTSARAPAQAGAEVVRVSRRALDVGEEQGDGAGREARSFPRV